MISKRKTLSKILTSSSFSACSGRNEDIECLMETESKACEKLLQSEIVLEALLGQGPFAVSNSAGLKIPSNYLLNIDCIDEMLSCYYERVTFKEDARTVIIFPGEEEKITDYIQHENNTSHCAVIRQIFVKMGLNVLIIQYRGYGAHACLAKVDIPKMLKNDIPKIYSKLSLPPEQLIIYGRSVLGGIMACEFGKVCPKVGGIILDSCSGNIYELLRMRIEAKQIHLDFSFWTNLRSAITMFLDQQHKIKVYKGKLLVLHNEHDSTIPMSQAETLYSSTGSSHKGFIIFNCDGHCTLDGRNMKQFLKEIKVFMCDIGVKLNKNFEHIMLQVLLNPGTSCPSSPSSSSTISAPSSPSSPVCLSPTFTFREEEREGKL